MTGKKFETDLCEILKAMGYWALDIPKNETGAQPFDVIAIHGHVVFAIDCKVCGRNSFPLERIEDNQWLAFEVMNDRTFAHVGVMAYNNGNVYFLPYGLLCDCRDSGVKSIKLISRYEWLNKEEIKEFIGRYLE